VYPFTSLIFVSQLVFRGRPDAGFSSMPNCHLRHAADSFAYCFLSRGILHTIWRCSPPPLAIGISIESRLVICLCTVHLTTLFGSCALGRRLSLPAVVPRHFIYHWNCSFSNNMSLLVMATLSIPNLSDH
jgi:hypothetical protein